MEPATGAVEVTASCAAGYAFDPLVDDFSLRPVAVLPERWVLVGWREPPRPDDPLARELVVVVAADDEDPEPGEPPEGPFSNAEPRIAWLPWPGPP